VSGATHPATGSLVDQARALVSGETDKVANAANISALLFMDLQQINWAGFYFLQGEELVLGPFQGKPACIRIPLGKGVCGTAAATRTPQLVADVHAFPGHIACDIESRSELVIPLLRGEELIGVLDLDSPVPGRFSEADLETLREVAAVYLDSID